eukprot:scaffold7344_cov122-Amphora_coffeaeformis.AAC.4
MGKSARNWALRSMGRTKLYAPNALNKKNFKLVSKDVSGSKDVMELVGNTLRAIGYSGKKYWADNSKFVKMKQSAG